MKNRCLIVSDGTKGMENQSIALAKILRFDFKILQIKSNFLLKIFPTAPKYFFFLFKGYKKIFFDLDAKFIITTGKRMAGYSILLKKIFNKNIITIHIQNPNIKTNNFDVIVAPEHDKLKGSNVFFFQGALSFFDSMEIKKSYDKFKKHFHGLKQPIVCLLIGGDNKRYKLSFSEYCLFLLKVRSLVKNISGSIIVSTSRRTPNIVKKIIELVFKSFENKFILTNHQENKFYPGVILNSKFTIVTSDSVNMISEVATTKSCLFVGYIRKEKGKIKEFNDNFHKKNYSRPLEHKLYLYKKKQLTNNKKIVKSIENYLKNLT